MRKYKTGLLQVLENQRCEKEDVELQVPTCVHSDVAESTGSVLLLVSEDATQLCDTQALEVMGRKLFA
jgi:hypothetical protein